MTMPAKHRYTVYRRRGDTPVIYDGTARECASAMKITVDSFYTIYTKQKNQTSQMQKKWEIILSEELSDG